MNIDALMRALIHARTRQREVMLPEPVGVILPTSEEFEDFISIFGLQIIQVDGAHPGLIIPLEVAE